MSNFSQSADAQEIGADRVKKLLILGFNLNPDNSRIEEQMHSNRKKKKYHRPSSIVATFSFPILISLFTGCSTVSKLYKKIRRSGAYLSNHQKKNNLRKNRLGVV
jgi:hypothetical protein